MDTTPNSTTPCSAAEGLDRRQFLATSSGLTLGFFLSSKTEEAQAAGSTLSRPTVINSWLSINVDDSINLTVGASDMGQGSPSGLAQVLCEDLMVDPSRITVLQGAPTVAAPAPIGTAINTVGSGVTRGNFWKLRDAAAIARETLVNAAMLRLGDNNRDHYTVENGRIHHINGKSVSYGDVARAASQLSPPASAPLVPDAQLRYIGKTIPRVDIPAKVDGSAVYGLDVRVPGMLYAVIKHCPSFGGTLAAVPPTPGDMTAVVPTKVAAGTAARVPPKLGQCLMTA